MEKLSNSMLIGLLQDNPYNDSVITEIERRLEAGDRAKQTIKELIPMINKMLEGK